jgi:hypothetical protein
MIKKTNKPIALNGIPKSIELFGRTIRTIDDTEKLGISGNYGEARYGVNEIAVNRLIHGKEITPDELKSTYLHELLHFILNFTGYEMIIRDGGRIDLEQFIELVASGIYQYEKSAKY